MRTVFSLALALTLLGSFTSTAPAQAPAAAPRAATAATPRRLAPGVLTTIPPRHDASETFSGPRPIVEIQADRELAWTPNYMPESDTLFASTKEVVFRREIWCLEFTFKPVRLIEVDIPQPTGKMQRKLIHYMMYRVRNLGQHLDPTEQKNERGLVTYDPKTVDAPIRKFPRLFVPNFTLESLEKKTAYNDRIIPPAVAAVQEREDPAIKLYNNAEICSMALEVSDEKNERGVWGVATWEDVDPNINFFTVYVQGLTNAYKWDDPAGAYTKGSPPGTGRKFTHKTLQLNFFKTGDADFQHEEEYHYGVPFRENPEEQQRLLGFYNLKEPLDYLWVYR